METIYQTADEDAVAARQRFESFRLGKGLPSLAVENHTKSSHARSHSRNTSVSSSLPTASFNPNRPSTDPLPVGTAPSKRPNSHHRRRSSVSTRRESAEMMGMAVPELPTSLSDDNINLGDKDSVRRRALWVLEGKPNVPYSKVEIPELSAFENEKKPFEFPTKPSFPPGTGAGYSMMGKRDSFKLLSSSSSSKDQLHTLVEEEEEEEIEALQKEETTNEVDVITSIEPVTPTVPVTNPPSTRPRPAHLKLRPLSLTPENLVTKFHDHGLPTPPNTASSSKSSSLNPSSALKSFLCTNNGDDSATKKSTNSMRRLSLTPSPSLSSTGAPSASSYDSPSPTPSDQDKPRRSSISYKTSHPVHHPTAYGLPTPEATPTSERRQSGLSSISSIEDDAPYSRPLSASEQHFLFKSHQALLARINDLERGLALRTRPSSCTSEASSHTSSQNASEPTDEMLQMVADLKAERDELKRDVDGWRMRVSDLENHISIYAKRVEAERRDAWVARSRVTLLDVEKSALERSLDEKTRECQGAMNKCEQFKRECERLRTSLETMQTELNKTRELEEECCRLRAALEQEKTIREALQKQLQKIDPLATPTASAFAMPTSVMVATGSVRTLKRGLGFESVDSESSTDVESFDDSGVLKTVVEDPEEPEAEISDEEDELARYEDEEDSDMSFRSGSSIDSLDDFRRATPVDVPTAAKFANMPSSSPVVVRPSHRYRASLSRTWTFPKEIKSAPTPDREEVDHFFNCLDDHEVSPPLPSVYEDDKGLFSKSFRCEDEMNDDDDMPPFLLPCDVGEEVVEAPTNGLEVVIEEEEEADEMREGEDDRDEYGESFEVGGIKITFTPPQPDTDDPNLECSSESLLSEPVPTYLPVDDDDYDESHSFNFGRPVNHNHESSQVKPVTPDASKLEGHKQFNTPSSIPRAISFKSPSGVEPITPPKTSLGRFIPATNGLITPPSKRGGTMPSFIPQPVSSPLRNATPSKQRFRPSATFIPQPPRKSSPEVNTKMNVTCAANVIEPMKPSPRSPPCAVPASPASASEVNGATMKTQRSNIIPHNISSNDQPVASPASSFTSFIPSPLAARLSSFIPISWAASQVRPVAAAALCLIPESSSTLNNLTGEEIGSRASLNDASGTCKFVEKKERRFVSKEEQLKKLRNRSYINDGTPDSCKRCKGGMVSI